MLPKDLKHGTELTTPGARGGRIFCRDTKKVMERRAETIEVTNQRGKNHTAEILPEPSSGFNMSPASRAERQEAGFTSDDLKHEQKENAAEQLNLCARHRGVFSSCETRKYTDAALCQKTSSPPQTLHCCTVSAAQQTPASHLQRSACNHIRLHT